MDVARICCRGLVFVTSIFKTGRERTVRFFLVFLSSPRIKYFLRIISFVLKIRQTMKSDQINPREENITYLLYSKYV